MPGLVESTIYRIDVVLEVRDKAKARFDDIEKSAGRAAQSTERLSTAVKAAGGALLATGAFALGKKMFIDFNSTVQDTKNTIAGMMALATKSDLNANLARADKLYENLQRRAATLPGTTAEYVAMAGMITQPIMDAGLKMKDLEDLTVSTVVGAKALRVEAGAAARDIDQALRGQYRSVDAFTGKLLGSQGYAGEAGRTKFNAMNPQKRAEALMKAVNAPQIQQLAAAQGATFSGLMSTVQDNIEQLGGKAGKPLFEALTKEVKSWVEYLDKNKAQIDRMAKSVGEGLVKGFEHLKGAVKFIVDHKDTLISIGKMWAGVKIAGMAGSALGGSLQGLASGVKGFSGKADFATITASLGQMAMLGTAAYMLTSKLMDATGATDFWTGALSPANRELRNTTNRLRAFGTALELAEQMTRDKKGAGGTKAATRATAEALLAIDQHAALQHVKQWYGIGKDFDKQWDYFERKKAYDKLESVGLDRDLVRDPDAFNNMMTVTRDKYQLQGPNSVVATRDLAAEQSNKLVSMVMADMPQATRDSIDQSKALEEVMQRMVNAMSRGDQSSMLSYQDVFNVLKDMAGTNLDNLNQKKPPVTNIKIDRVEVAAKDPDRWIAELDAKARSRVRAPRGPRSAIPGGM
jgi:hypothetical protein